MAEDIVGNWAETERKKKVKEARIQGIDPPPKRKNIMPPNPKSKKKTLVLPTPNFESSSSTVFAEMEIDDAEVRLSSPEPEPLTTGNLLPEVQDLSSNMPPNTKCKKKMSNSPTSSFKPLSSIVLSEIEVNNNVQLSSPKAPIVTSISQPQIQESAKNPKYPGI